VAWTKSWVRRFFYFIIFLCQLRDKVTALLRKHRYFLLLAIMCHPKPFCEEWDTHTKIGLTSKQQKRRSISTREWKELKMEIIKFS
jgi:hypothetical protein